MDKNMQRVGETKAFKDRNLILKGADIATQRGWTGVPNFILEGKQISVGAKLTYAMLLKYARELDECFPGQDRLAEDLGTTRQSVNTYIRELRQVGLISVERRGQGKPNLYTVHIKASFWKKNR
jgi:biotin operon repressor